MIRGFGKKCVIPISLATLSVGIIQGYNLRQQYFESEKLSPPSGPQRGYEKWVEKWHDIKKNIAIKYNDDPNLSAEESNSFFKKSLNKVIRVICKDDNVITNEQLLKRSSTIKTVKPDSNETLPSNNGVNKPEEVQVTNKKRIKLLVLGDSLVSGVGCEKIQGSPVLPAVLARVLSLALQTDVEWFSLGMVGGTVSELRDKLLPQIKELMIDSPSPITPIITGQQNSILKVTNQICTEHLNKVNTEFIVVIICGLNDWRCMLENFPYGSGPSTFRKELGKLVGEIKQLTSETTASIKCRVFLPALPIMISVSDPNFILRIQPLNLIVSFICRLFDHQKRSLAVEDDQANTMFIEEPSDLSALYATPGLGNISSDGIHPSSQGYHSNELYIHGATLTASFYALQQLVQRAVGKIGIHGRILPSPIMFPVGMVITTVNMITSEYIFQECMKLMPHSSGKKQKVGVIQMRKKDDWFRFALVGLTVFTLIEKNWLRAVFPSSVITLGAFAINRDLLSRKSILSFTAAATEVQRTRIQKLGKRFGCHQCGSRQLFRPLAHFIADHMPPTKFANLENKKWWRRALNLPVQQRLWPQCLECFSLQGTAVRSGTHVIIYHKSFRTFHFAPLLAFLLCQDESFRTMTQPFVHKVVKAQNTIEKQLKKVLYKTVSFPK